MSETGYVIWFIATCVFVTGLLVALVLRSMGWFEHNPRGFVRQLPNEPTSREAYEHNRRLLESGATEPHRRTLHWHLPHRHDSGRHAA